MIYPLIGFAKKNYIHCRWKNFSPFLCLGLEWFDGGNGSEGNNAVGVIVLVIALLVLPFSSQL
jgi:hypothetical protein